MAPRRVLPLRLRLALGYTGLLVATLLALGGFLYEETYRQGLTAEEALLRAAATDLASQADVRNGILVPPDDLTGLPAGTYFAFYGLGGRRLLLHGPSSALPPANLRRTVGVPVVYRHDHEQWLSLSLPLKEGGEPAARLVVFRSLHITQAAARRLLLWILVALPGLVCLSAFLGYWWSRRALEPIDRVIRTARAIREQNLSERIAGPSSGDEVGLLIATLNDMLSRLENAFRRERRFTSDASHELRTPLAVVRAQAEAALADDDPETWRTALSVIRRESERMTAMLAHMLALARADADRPTAVEPVDLNALVEGTASSFQLLAEEAGVTLIVEAEPRPIVVAGDQELLTKALVNLVQNALDFTPRGGTVIVRTKLDERRAVALLSVTDTGVGILPEDAPHIFERFYRGRLPRPGALEGRPHAAPGAGLGLALVRTAVERSGGSVDLVTAPNGGSTFTLILPLGRAPQSGEHRAL